MRTAVGFRPNLKQMHHDACTRVPADLVEARLEKEIASCKSLTSGASATGAKVHLLPDKPRDIEDDGEFHYAILGPRAVSSPGRPGPEAQRFIDEKTGPDSPRTKRNAIVLAVPSIDGLEAARNAIRDYSGWLNVEDQLKGQEVDTNRKQLLDVAKADALKKITEMVRQAYCIVVTVSEKNEVQAFKVVVTNEPLFNIIKADKQSRIQETPVSYEALLPEGPYDLWREGETARRVDNLVGAFADSARLPKMLNRKAILDTLIDGCRNGAFVLRSFRPDRTFRTCWHEMPDDVMLKDPGLEVVLPEAAMLDTLPPKLLSPGVLPDLWHGPELALKDLYSYFSGRTVQVERVGYEDIVVIPQAGRDVVDAAIQAAVKEKKLWLTSETASFFAEDIPAGVLSDNAYLQAPPQPVPVKDILPENLPEAWSGETTTTLEISHALSTKVGKMLPWITVREAIDGAFRSRLIERTDDSGGWPCGYENARFVTICLPKEQVQTPVSAPPSELHTPRPSFKPGLLVAEAPLRVDEVQDLADHISEIAKAALGLDLKLSVHMELGPTPRPSEEAVAKINQLLQEVSEQLQLRPS